MSSQKVILRNFARLDDTKRLAAHVLPTRRLAVWEGCRSGPPSIPATGSWPSRRNSH